MKIIKSENEAPGMGKKLVKEKMQKKIFSIFFQKQFFSKVLAHMLAQVHAQSSLLHAQWFTKQTHPRASIDINGIKFEAILPCILTTLLKSLKKTCFLFYNLNFAWRY